MIWLKEQVSLFRIWFYLLLSCPTEAKFKFLFVMKYYVCM